MLRNTHQFNVGVAHIVDILRQFLCGTAVVVEAVRVLVIILAPGAEMHLIDGHRLVLVNHVAVVFLVVLPLLVMPFVCIQIGNDRGVIRTALRCIAIRIGFQHDIAVFILNGELIQPAFADTRHKKLPDAGSGDHLHGTLASVPGIEIANYTYTSGIRRPDSEIRACLSVLLCQMCPHFVVDFIMIPLSKKIGIQSCKSVFKSHK